MSMQFYKLCSKDLLKYLAEHYNANISKRNNPQWEEIWGFNTETKKYYLLQTKYIYTDVNRITKFKRHAIDPVGIPYYEMRLKSLKPITEAEVFVEMLNNENAANKIVG